MKNVTQKVLLCFCLLVSFNTFAKDNKNIPETRKVMNDNEWKPHVGLLLGVAMPEGNYDSSAEYGLDIGYQPLIPFGLGLEISHSEIDADGGGDLERTNVLVKGTFNFGGDTMILKNSYIGLGLGAVFKDSDTDLVSAPLIGFDIPLTNSTRNYMSLGASAKYAIYEGSDPDALSLNAVLKYWF